MTRSDDDWVRLDAVRASIGDFLDQTGADPLRIDCGHTTLHVTRAGSEYAVDYYGPAGGWYDARRCSKHELVRYVEGVDAAIEIKRPESQRPEGDT